MKYVFILFSILFYISANAQSITFEELVSLKSKDVNTAQRYLENKGWYLFSELQPASEDLGCIVFALEIEKNADDFSTSRSFILYFFSIKNVVNKIEFITGSATKFDAFMNQINQLEFKIIDSELDNRKSRTTYEISKDVRATAIKNSEFKNKHYSLILESN